MTDETVEERRERVMRTARETLERLAHLGTETRAGRDMPHSSEGAEGAEGASDPQHHFDPVRRSTAWRDRHPQQEEPQPREHRHPDAVLMRMIERNVMVEVEKRLELFAAEVHQVVGHALAALADQSTILETMLEKLTALQKEAHAKATKAHEHEGNKGEPVEPISPRRVLN